MLMHHHLLFTSAPRERVCTAIDELLPEMYERSDDASSDTLFRRQWQVYSTRRENRCQISASTRHDATLMPTSKFRFRYHVPDVQHDEERTSRSTERFLEHELLRFSMTC
jgi:hypothetical protein